MRVIIGITDRSQVNVSVANNRLLVLCICYQRKVGVYIYALL